MKNTDTVRVQLDILESRIQELEEVRKKCGLSTRKDVFENALQLFEWAVAQAEKGAAIGAYDEKKEEFLEVVMPCMERLKK